MLSQEEWEEYYKNNIESIKKNIISTYWNTKLENKLPVPKGMSMDEWASKVALNQKENKQSTIKNIMKIFTRNWILNNVIYFNRCGTCCKPV